MNKNLKKVIAPVAAAAMVLAVPTGVYAEDGAQEKITFCLDWTPNTNHTGLYVAQAKKATTKKLVLMWKSFSHRKMVQPLCAQQVRLSLQSRPRIPWLLPLALDEPLGITAVAGIIQHNTSGILFPKR